jgi:CheY-like chemotaxis protein
MMDPGNHPILLIEDDPNDQVLIRRAFAKAKLMNPLHMVDDGDAAVDYLAGDGQYADRQLHPLPTLILLDLKLPRRSGLEVLEWLRAQPGCRRIPVVVLTSSEDSADIARAYDLGANSYLVKPVDFDGLLELLRTVGLYWMVMNQYPTQA